ncbi:MULTISPECIES: hypothetical protein [unclassified Rhodanobacter]|uniref:hypothetical protein n=1 Tax=unclassified Rhodanobacter TaxID=2621553 RepID=UPI001BDE5138|nr:MULTISPECIES: hypothetical protein [unclassified Rhodanobacter]MBT2144196.1 hypothetical protein [Rhodanobacter sp. LX-99]MBT2150137.1 hypothetical protein [Rhodanobacter sp. LX-100]
MKQTTAANLALILVVAGWLLAFFGVTSQLGDPSPSVPRAQIEAARHLSIAVLGVGVVCILIALCLSGFSFTAAKVRSCVCAALGFLPAIAVIWSML